MSISISRTVLEKGCGLVQEGKLGEGRRVLEAFCAEGELECPPGEKACLFWRDAADALRQAGMYEASLRLWKRAGETGLKDETTRLEIACTLIAAGKFSDAAERLAILASEAPKNSVVANLHAIALFESGNYDAAMGEWERCLKYSAQIKCPLSTHPYYLSLGTLALERYMLQNQEATGSADELESSEAAPGMGPAKRVHRIEAALEKNEALRALKWINYERAHGGNDDYLALLRASALGSLGHWPRAREEIAAVLDRQEEMEPLHAAFYAYALYRCGEAEVALKVLQAVQPEGPDDYFRHYFEACAHMALGHRCRALLNMQTAFTLYFFDNYEILVLPLWQRTKECLTINSGT
ncbi:MAG: tetratricopeptide repeat protein [Candidatus Sumerlaeia bacterium]